MDIYYNIKSKQLSTKYGKQEAEAKERFLRRTGKKIARGFTDSPEYKKVSERRRVAEYRLNKRAETLLKADESVLKAEKARLTRLLKTENVSKADRKRVSKALKAIEADVKPSVKLIYSSPILPIFALVGYGRMPDLFREIYRQERDSKKGVTAIFRNEGFEKSIQSGLAVTLALKRMVRKAADIQSENDRKYESTGQISIYDTGPQSLVIVELFGNDSPEIFNAI